MTTVACDILTASKDISLSLFISRLSHLTCFLLHSIVDLAIFFGTQATQKIPVMIIMMINSINGISAVGLTACTRYQRLCLQPQ